MYSVQWTCIWPQRQNSWMKSSQMSQDFSSLLYSQSPPRLCLEIYISSNSRNLLQFIYGSKNPYRNPKPEKLSRLCPKTSRKLYVHEFGFWLVVNVWLIIVVTADDKGRAGIFKPLWSPGIDAKASIPPAYVAWRAGTITLFLLGA